MKPCAQTVALLNITGLLAGFVIASINGGLRTFTITDVLHNNLVSMFVISLFFVIACATTVVLTNEQFVWIILASLLAVIVSESGPLHDIGALVGFGAMVRVGKDLGFARIKNLLTGLAVVPPALLVLYLMDFGTNACVEYSLFLAVNASLLCLDPGPASFATDGTSRSTISHMRCPVRDWRNTRSTKP